MQAKIIDIQRFSINDGPGIRTTVFLKGCNLNCAWCHNPESISLKDEMQFFEDKCVKCGMCIDVCPTGAKLIFGIDREKCIACGKCETMCCYDALNKAGREIDLSDIEVLIDKDKSYFDNSDGGITFSGGEAMLQHEFVLEACKLCKEKGVHVAIDTALAYDYSLIEKIMPYVDMFLIDIKSLDYEKHKEFVGGDNRIIKENIKKLFATDKDIEVRIPVVPGVNNTVKDMNDIADFISDAKNIVELKLLPYHDYGVRKAKSLGKEMTKFDEVTNLEELKSVFLERNIELAE